MDDQSAPVISAANYLNYTQSVWNISADFTKFNRKLC